MSRDGLTLCSDYIPMDLLSAVLGAASPLAFYNYSRGTLIGQVIPFLLSRIFSLYLSVSLLLYSNYIPMVEPPLRSLFTTILVAPSNRSYFLKNFSYCFHGFRLKSCPRFLNDLTIASAIWDMTETT